MSRFFCVCLLGLLGLSLMGQSVVFSNAKRAPHVELRALMAERDADWEYDRWFMPGPLGWSPAERPDVQSQRSQGLRVSELNEGAVGAGVDDREVVPPAGDLRRAQPVRRSLGEGGRSRPTLTERSFLTRAFYGVTDADWKMFNQLTPRLRFSHNLSRVFPAELFDSRPELFPLVDGERMKPGEKRINWNPDLGGVAVASVAAEAAMKYFDENPEAVSFALGINDGLRFGESPATLNWVEPLRWFRDRPDYSDLIFNFTNEVAAQTNEQWPDKYVGALAYYWAENVPSFPVHPNVIPFLTADRSQFYDGAFKREELELQKKWGAAHAPRPWSKSLNVEGGEALLAGRRSEDLKAEGRGTGGQGGFNARAVSGTGQTSEIRLSNVDESREQRVKGASENFRSQVSSFSFPPHPISPRLGLYDYIYGAGFLIPRIHTQALAEHLRHARRAGFTDYFAEVNPNWGLDGPQPWLLSQLLLDTEQSADRLLREYYRRYFKAAERPMRRFFERCETIWSDQAGAPYWLKHFRNDSQAALFPPEVCEKLRGLIDEAGRRAEGDALVSQRVKLVSDAFGVTERFSRFHIARVALQRSLLGKTERPKSAGAEAEGRVTGRQGDLPELSCLLQEYHSARAEFIRYVAWLKETQPLALSKWDLTDFLRNDPGPTAAALIASEKKEDEVVSARIPNPLEMGWQGERVPVLDIAGLPYSVALPKGWNSSVEPWQGLVAELQIVESGNLTQGCGDGEFVKRRDQGEHELDAKFPVLRLEHNKLTSVSRVVPKPWLGLTDPVRGAWLEIEVRGHVGVSSFLCLTATKWDWDVKQVDELKEVKLPEGNWPEWVMLRLWVDLPDEAAYLNYELWCAHQQVDDWLEFRNPRIGWQTNPNRPIIEK